MNIFGYCRWCYNNGLNLWNKEYENGNKPNWRKIRDLLKTDLPEWSDGYPKQIVDTACEHLGNAFSKFFSKDADYPKFKSRHNTKQSFELYRKNDSSIRIRNKKWLLQKEEIKISENLRFNATIKRLTCSKVGEKYYISLVFDYELPKPEDNGTLIGLDWGVRNKKGEGNYFTGNNGETFNLVELYEYEKRIEFRQKCLSRKIKGSNRYYKAKAKLYRSWEILNNIKRDSQNKLVAELVKTYSTIAMENLKFVNMTSYISNKNRSKFRYSNSEIREQLKRKAFKVVFADTYFPSSQLCSQCGKRHYEMRDEKIREFKCSCGLLLNRDINAARNILSVASKNI